MQLHLPFFVHSHDLADSHWSLLLDLKYRKFHRSSSSYGLLRSLHMLYSFQLHLHRSLYTSVSQLVIQNSVLQAGYRRLLSDRSSGDLHSAWSYPVDLHHKCDSYLENVLQILLYWLHLKEMEQNLLSDLWSTWNLLHEILYWFLQMHWLKIKSLLPSSSSNVLEELHRSWNILHSNEHDLPWS